MLDHNKRKTRAGSAVIEVHGYFDEQDNAPLPGIRNMERAEQLFQQGQELYRHFDMLGALNLLSESVREDPSHDAAKMKLRYVTEEIDDIQDELAELRPALGKSPDNPELNYRVGKLTYLLGHIVEGMTLLNRAADASDSEVAEKATKQLRKLRGAPRD